MGAGVFGLSIAFACLRRGAAVQVIDPNGVAAGASGGIVGALAPHVPEQWNPKKEFQRDSLFMQPAFWASVEDISGEPTGYAKTGRLQPIADTAALVLAQSRTAGADLHWQGQAQWQVMPAPDDGWSPPSATGQVINDTMTALIHPRTATNALAAAVVAMGGTIAPAGVARGQVVWATGWQGLQTLNQNHHRQIGNGVKGQAALLDYDAAGKPQIFVDGVHIVPHLNGTVAIGSTSEREFNDAHSTDEQLDDVIAKAKQATPILADAPVIEKWAGVRPRSRSRAPMLGHHPQRTGEFIANGGFKIGFGMAPKIADVMADLMLENVDRIPPPFAADANL